MLCKACYQLVEFYWQADRLWQVQNNFPTIYFDQLWVMAKFKSPLSNLIKALKYHSHSRAGQFFGQMLYFHLNLNWSNYDLITFIPIHLQKKKLRGYNQAAIIASELALWNGLTVSNLLERRKNTRAQARVKSKTERLARLEGIFRLKQEFRSKIKGKKILLIDDVITTGATVNGASRVLKAADATQITVLTVASKF